MVQHLTLENFQSEVIDSDLPVVIDFYADWCGPCQMMTPVFESLSKQYKGRIKFLKLDTQVEKQVAMQFGVRSIPTFIVIRDSRVIEQFAGFRDEDSFREKIDSILKD